MKKEKIAVIHQTDCFHTLADPDDHWDLACQFALAYINDIDLKGVLIDYPPYNKIGDHYSGDPAIAAVQQLNYLSGQYVPVAVGAEKTKSVETIKSEKHLNGGIKMILDTLENSPKKVAIQIVGSCRDVAIAVRMRPDLFEKKCQGIYLNAGTATEKKEQEYNVSLDPISYKIMFSLPCPLYWMPCFQSLPFQETVSKVNETYYSFMQKDVLPYLNKGMKQYFSYALSREESNQWLAYLKKDVNEVLLKQQCEKQREMWSTAGIFHAAGKTVDVNGTIWNIDKCKKETVFKVVPISAVCDDFGRVMWKRTEKSNQYIFVKTEDRQIYAKAMTNAIKEILSELP